MANTSSSCVDLIFTSDTGVITQFRVEKSFIHTGTIVLFLVR